MIKKLITASLMATISSSTAFAHVSLEKTEALVGSTYKAILRIPHGCEGKPTNVVRVKIPEGVIAVKPMPKAGWELEKKRGQYGKSYDYYGTATTEGVTEVIWSGGNLGDDEYDEFVLRGYLTTDLKAGDMLYFPVVQQCPGDLAERWIEIPGDGQTSDDLELPAPGLKLLEKTSGH
ncbi:YcnI family protein [Paenochrobactrum sp. BZR 588]|uniref:YcnI family copper-binding membrane protein n=1 Tax=unclassified Paenochrobactrum TaxID=2639760 RepID=UPI003853D1D5